MRSMRLSGRRVGVVAVVMGLSGLVLSPAAAEPGDGGAVVATASDGTVTYRDPGLVGEDTRRVEGLLRKVVSDDESGHSRETTAITTDDGKVLPVSLDTELDQGEAPVVARLVDGPALDAALAGERTAPVEVASARIAPETAAAATAGPQRAYVAVVTNSGSDLSDSATLEARVDAGLRWWATEADEAMTSFTRQGSTQRFDSGLSATDRCGLSNPYPLWNEAAAQFPGVSFNDPGNHLVVIVSGGCSGTGIGTIGSSVSSGGFVSMIQTASVFRSTIGHELGHNFSLDHANYCAPGCSSPAEYWDLYSVMGLAVSGGTGFLPGALDSVYRSQLGITDAGETAEVPAGQSVTRNLAPRGSSSGLRGLSVVDGDTTYWIEWRDGTGRDAGTFYQAYGTQNAFGNGRTFPTGVTVQRQATGSDDPTVLLARTAGGLTAGSYGAGQSVTAGDVTVTVNSIGSTANVTVTSAAPVPVVVGTPTISGTAKVGVQLTADEGSWSPQPSTYAYRWFADDVVIAGATSRTFTPAASQLGTRLRVEVTGVREGSTLGTATSAAVGPVASGTFTAGTPTVSGTAGLGRTLTASTGTWSPTPDSFTYQWLADDVAVGGATEETFVPGTSQVGKVMKVRVSGVRTAYAPAPQTSAGTAAVAPGDLVAGTPSVLGAAKVGSTLTAAPGAWSPTPGFTYQWSANGLDVSGATAKTFTLGAGQVGRRISVRVTGTLSGYTTTSATSGQTAVVAAGTLTAKTPTIAGTVKVGRTLKVTTGTWSPKPGFTYQWKADDKAIAKATGSSFKLTKAQKGKRITVAVTGRLSGYTTTVKTSAKTAKVG